MFNTASGREAPGSSRKLADEPHSAPECTAAFCTQYAVLGSSSPFAGPCESAPGAAAGERPSLRSKHVGSLYFRQHTVFRWSTASTRSSNTVKTHSRQ